MTDTTEPRCVIPDPYHYLVDCGQKDPCFDTQTLWTLMDCSEDSPSMAEFCGRYTDHPVCPAVVVEVGEPPVPPLPSTGSGVTTGGLLLGGLLMAVGICAVRFARHVEHRNHHKESK